MGGRSVPGAAQVASKYGTWETLTGHTGDPATTPLWVGQLRVLPQPQSPQRGPMTRSGIRHSSWSGPVTGKTCADPRALGTELGPLGGPVPPPGHAPGDTDPGV